MVIKLNQALALMDVKDKEGRPNFFSISFFTYNKKEKTGGELKVIPKATKCGMKFNMNENSVVGIQPEEKDSHPIAVHMRLITQFNGQKVIY